MLLLLLFQEMDLKVIFNLKKKNQKKNQKKKKKRWIFPNPFESAPSPVACFN